MSINETRTRQPHPFAENGARIRSARRRSGKSQEGLAAEVGTTRRHMIRLENGEHLPSGELRDRIAEHTGQPKETFQSADDADDRLPRPGRSLAVDLQQLAQLAGLLERRPGLLDDILAADAESRS